MRNSNFMTQKESEVIQNKLKSYGRDIIVLIICGFAGIIGSLALVFTENYYISIVVAIFSSTLLIIAAITNLQSEIIEYLEKKA
jgi:hypothetical protein